MINTSYLNGTVYAGEHLIDVSPKIPYSLTKPGIAFASGAGENALTWLGIDALGQELDMYCSEYPGVIGDNGGGATWGNATSITRLGGYISRLIGRSDTGSDYALIGNSMGGLVALNYAAQASVKPKCIVLQIPVINLEDIRANNRNGFAAAINVAYGGTYNEATMGATYNPYTMKDAAKLKNIPMLILYSTTDTICLPTFTTQFAAGDPSFRTLVPQTEGHSYAFYAAINKDAVLAFLKTHLG